MTEKHIEIVTAGSLLQPTTVFRKMAAEATAEFLLFIGKGGVLVDDALLDGMLRAMPADAVMGYSHYRKRVDGVVVDAPTIDCLPGSLRNDFDFGAVVLFRVSALKRYLGMRLDEYEFAGFYQLRLAMQRLGAVYHHCEYVYTIDEDDMRKSGERQFDYVNPAQRNVQIEMEAVCTHHLKQVGAWLLPCRYDSIDLTAGEFPVEASVVIPVLNRESTIADAIKSVLGQKTSFPFNILVVDNHSTDGTSEIIDSFADGKVVHIIPSSKELGIGGCWNLAVNDARCGRFAVQLDSDDIYCDENTLQRVVDGFYEQQCAMLIGSYRICDFELNTLPPGVIDHREWSEDNGRNNALRINGLGAPRAFFTPVIREVGFPNVSYGEDYAVGLQISRRYRVGRIYDVLYLCRRWGGNSDAALSHAKVNAHNLYKDGLRNAELMARCELMRGVEVPSDERVDAFFEEQLAVWPEAAGRFEALGGVKVRSLENGISLQYNSARAVSTAARVDAASVSARPCFLCGKNRPAQQIALDVLDSLQLLVNPYPILPCHLTLPLKGHVPQLLAALYADALHLARGCEQRVFFYNGARCGASAPDHAHLQSVKRHDVPMLCSRVFDNDSLETVLALDGGVISRVTDYIVPCFVITSDSVSASIALMDRLMVALPVADGDAEPMMNVFVSCSCKGYTTIVLPRTKHRPACYYADGLAQRLVSPGALDMAGLIVTPRECDFENITANEAVAILREVAISFEDADAVVERLKGAL